MNTILYYTLPLFITVATATIMWSVLKKIVKGTAISWGTMYFLAFASCIISVYIFAHYNFSSFYKSLMVYESVTIVLALLTIPLFLRFKDRFEPFINGFVPIAIPVGALFHFLLFNSFLWKVQGSVIYQIPENGIQKTVTFIDTCRDCTGFPLPSMGTFYQGNTGEIEISRLGLSFDLLCYLVVAYFIYRLLRNRINWKNIFVKIGLVLYCGVAYYYCWLILFSLALYDADPYPVNTHILGAHFKFLGGL